MHTEISALSRATHPSQSHAIRCHFEYGTVQPRVLRDMADLEKIRDP